VLGAGKGGLHAGGMILGGNGKSKCNDGGKENKTRTHGKSSWRRPIGLENLARANDIILRGAFAVMNRVWPVGARMTETAPKSERLPWMGAAWQNFQNSLLLNLPFAGFVYSPGPESALRSVAASCS
jgi:hypothetical protein